MLPSWFVYVILSIIVIGSYYLVRKYWNAMKNLLRRRSKKIVDGDNKLRWP